jgi:hypothetical protein
MSGRVEVGVQGNALQAIKYDCANRDEGIEHHGAVYHLSEVLRVEKTKVKEQEGHLDDPVHPCVIYFFHEKSVHQVGQPCLVLYVDFCKMSATSQKTEWHINTGSTHKPPPCTRR